MNRREFLSVSGTASVVAGLTGQAAVATDAQPNEIALTKTFDPTEKSFAELDDALQSGTATSASLTLSYLARIEIHDRSGSSLNAVIATNPRALSMARDLDTEQYVTRNTKTYQEHGGERIE